MLPKIIAHRGASGHCPENTMAAFRKAVELGAQGIETDVHLTKDGQIVCIHDETLDRTTEGSGYIKDYTLAEIQQHSAGRWYDESFASEKVPTLEELFELAVSHDLILNIEIKNNFVAYPGIEERLAAMVKRFNWVKKTIISSFNHESLARCKQVDSSIETAILYGENLFEPWKYAKLLPADTLHPPYYTVNAAKVEAASEQGVKMNVWTINGVEEMKQLVQYGVHGIITDYPDRLYELYASMQ